MASHGATDSEIDAAVAQADAAETAGNTADNGTDTEPTSVKGMISAIKKHSDGTNIIKESIKTFSNPDGTDHKDDRWVKDKQQGVALIGQWVEAARNDPQVKPKKRAKWDFATSPHEAFGKTLDDLYHAFVMWSRVEETNEQDGSKYFDFNVSKAFRRLESYAEWMHDSGGAEIAELPLLPDNVKQCIDTWAMRSSIAKSGQFVWWFDMGKIDFDAVKHKYSLAEHTRAFVWFAHAVMYNPNAQEHGIIFCEEVNKLGFIQSMTMVPPKLGTKLDRLTIGVLPVKMNAMYLLSTPIWMDVLMKFMGMFMSKKMKKRVNALKVSEWHKLEEALGGKEYVIKDFGKLGGTLETDPIQEAYFS